MFTFEPNPIPRIGVTYLTNPYDHSRFGDLMLGSVIPAAFICENLQKSFPECRLVGSALSEREVMRVQKGKEVLFIPEDHEYEYSITIEPDPASPLALILKEVEKTQNASSIDLKETPPIMAASLKRKGDLLKQQEVLGTDYAASILALMQELSPDKTLLIQLPYFTFSEFDAQNFVQAEGRLPIPLSPLDLFDPSVRESLKPWICPQKEIPQILFNQGSISILMNVRAGGSNSDSEATLLRYPAKFPPLPWYAQCIEELVKKYLNQHLHIHIATDGNPQRTQEQLIQACHEKGLENIHFTYSKPEDYPPKTNLADIDLWGARKVNVIICPDSAFGMIISLNADPDSLEYIFMPKPADTLQPSTIKIPVNRLVPLSSSHGKHTDIFSQPNENIRIITGRQRTIDSTKIRIIKILTYRNN